MHLVVQSVATVALLAIAAFAMFGFLASGEVVDLAAQLVWRIGYAAIAISSLVGIWLVWFRNIDGAASVRNGSLSDR
jgi:hypothetical protein